MRKKLTKADTDFQMFADYYKLYQDFYVPEEGDTYWQSLISEADAFLKKYKTKYAEDLITAYLDSRQRIYKDLKMP